MRSVSLALSAAFVLLQCLGSTDARLSPLSPLTLKGLSSKRPAAAKRQSSSEFPEYTFTQPLDHFSDTGFTFEQHYWLSDRHYKPGGPVIVFEGGEGPGDFRIPILDTGIVDILAKATNGLGIILEHRYYGRSRLFYNSSLRLMFSPSVRVHRELDSGSELYHRFPSVSYARPCSA